uniref:Uncharacterized protein n=2 Tax=Graphocephala atropunctata TaxID=36148 RepID=A0A1B6M261_9HEMI
MLQANLQALQEQLNKIVQAKDSADKKEVEDPVVRKREDSNSHLQWKIDVTVEEKKEEDVEEDVLIQEEKTETVTEEIEETIFCEPGEYEIMETIPNGYAEHCNNIVNKRQREDDEGSVCKPPMIRNFPRTVAERPIVLPGGRKWYTPRDAYNEDFIAETIINQSEVLVGSTIGLNFRKYEPPKFDAANSAVYRLVREIEGRVVDDVVGLPIEGRPEKVLAEEDYFPPISKRHFFAARLAEQTNEHVEKILQDTNEQDIISV